MTDTLPECLRTIESLMRDLKEARALATKLAEHYVKGVKPSSDEILKALRWGWP